MDSITAAHDDPRLISDTIPSNNEDLRLNTEPTSASNDDTGFVIMDSISAANDDPRLISDTIFADNDDMRMSMESTFASNDDPGNPLDFDYALRCVNCGTDVSLRRRQAVRLTDVLSVLRRWTAPQLIEDGSLVCNPCWIVALNESRLTQPSTSTGRHRQLCANCRCSLLRTRYHILGTNNEIRRVIGNWIQPRELSGTSWVCHNCWARAERALTQERRNRNNTENINVVNIVEEVENMPHIELSHIVRAGESQSHCFVHGCEQPERLNVPMWLKIKLFKAFNFYVPPSCRICTWHLYSNDWDFLTNTQSYLHLFTAAHIEDFASFIKMNEKVDWNDVAGIEDALFFHWVGLKKTQFQLLFSVLTPLTSKSFGSKALIAYLCKLRTADSHARLATMLDIPQTTLKRYIEKARDALETFFVPHNLGIGHITREEISSRNLLIPKELFTNNNEPIVIVDGTYVYVQKSSNYLYQKNTYSLHKYRNLMKPLLIVCSDGYIVDVLGPYPATTSDANIISEAFRNSDQPLRQYFQAGDVFILDRGFRDCISLLEQCNYSPCMPASLQPGETQLSTVAANKSRKVTLCRWVVEAVNGIMKKCFKLFRHEYFNAATSHAMIDFKIAAALVNKFHQRFVDREDVMQIIQRIHDVEFQANDLADYIVQNNLNRRRTLFTSLTDTNVPFPTLQYSEMILIACGTYQLKQARSYYQESLRSNGSYTVEICNGSNLVHGFPLAENCTLIRGKIQSRHISRKIYFTYILFLNGIDGINSIKQYYCNCMVGRRTIGCCAHVCTIIWYLGWARHQNSVSLPAQHLDNILIVFEEEEEQ